MKIEPSVLENAVVRLEPLTEDHREALRWRNDRLDGHDVRTYRKTDRRS